ncbi:MAG: magnesium transporter CorA family protein [Gaiellales bacterium]|jgi:Mg2+ and Co2+ transporter CorA
MIEDSSPRSEHGVVKAYLFDKRQGEMIEDWAGSLQHLSKSQMLWIDLQDASSEQAAAVFDALDLGDIGESGIADPDRTPAVEQHEGHLRVTAVAVSEAERDPDRERTVIDCFLGSNWLLTAHMADIAALDEFRRVAEGRGEIGMLDAPSFLSTVLEWVVTSYLDAFDEVEESLDEFDVKALSNPSKDPEEEMRLLSTARGRVGRLRRTLAPHRDVFTALSHSEFDPLSSEESAERFRALTARVDAALASARDARDGIASSFDVLIVRTEHRTNEIMKVLTLASILLLPGALLASVAGMNVNFGAQTFLDSLLFWLVVSAIILIAASTLTIARLRRWI